MISDEDEEQREENTSSKEKEVEGLHAVSKVAAPSMGEYLDDFAFNSDEEFEETERQESSDENKEDDESKRIINPNNEKESESERKLLY